MITEVMAGCERTNAVAMCGKEMLACSATLVSASTISARRALAGLVVSKMAGFSLARWFSARSRPLSQPLASGP
jgi:hypothetical protein